MPDSRSIQDEQEFRPKFGPDGLITAVAVEAETGDILMLAHMNAQALEKTLSSGQAHYWSRSRQEIWHKGATSGQIQTIVDIRVDCDQDALLLYVKVGGDGGACHLGCKSCFHRRLVPDPAGAKAPHPAHRLTLIESPP